MAFVAVAGRRGAFTVSLRGSSCVCTGTRTFTMFTMYCPYAKPSRCFISLNRSSAFLRWARFNRFRG